MTPRTCRRQSVAHNVRQNLAAKQRRMAYFLQQLINGLTLDAIYGLIAIGYTMVYGIIGMINFAHGEIYMIGAFVALVGILALTSVGIASVPLLLLLVIIGAMAIAGLYGWTIERLIYRPLRG